MSLLNAQRIVNAILRLVDAQDQATFAELDRHVPGFRARRKQDGRQLAWLETFDKVILWTGVSASGIDAITGPTGGGSCELCGHWQHVDDA
jgi:hypothetical protein